MNQNQFISLFFLIALQFVFQQCTVEEQPGVKNTKTVLHAVEEIRIGQLEGEDEYVFGAINHMAIGKNGKIFVADRQVPVIRMYDKEGDFIRNVGRQGRGPGEYLRIGGMRTFPDGQLAIWDQRNLKVSLFDQKGDFLESHSVNSSLFAADIFEVDHTGNFYVKTVLRNTPDMPNWEFGWLKISPEGELVDTVKVPLDEEDRELTFVLFTASGDAHAFIKKPFTSMSALGCLITGRNDEYTFEINCPNSISKKIEQDYTPVQIKPKERAQWESWVSHFDVNNIIPEVKPPYKKILTDSQGRIWIWRYVEAEYTEKNIGPHSGPESKWWEPPTFDVFLPDGTFYATVKLPLNANFRDAKDDLVWAIIKGEYDEQYAARFRLEKIND